MSIHNAAVAALAVAIEGIAGIVVRRDEAIPQNIPTGGLVIVRDGDPGEPEVTLGQPVFYSYEHRAIVEAMVQDGVPGARVSALDAILGSIGTTIAADRTLAGAVNYAAVEAAVIEEEQLEGAAPVRAAEVGVMLVYTTSDPLN